VADTVLSGLPAYCHFVSTTKPSPCILARLRIGDSTLNGAAELLINGSEGHVEWDPNLGDGLDSGPFAIELAASAGSGARLRAVKDATDVNVSDGSVSYGAIQGVQIVASVAGVRRRCTWSAITVRFFRGGQQTQAMVRPNECQPKADTYGIPSVGWQAVEYAPTASDNDSVTITGQIRLQADNPIVNPWEVEAQILVFAANCAAM
jgi:hypothetical protein